MIPNTEPYYYGYCPTVSIDVDDSGGEIKVDYKLEIDDNKTGENDLHMLIRN